MGLNAVVWSTLLTLLSLSSLAYLGIAAAPPLCTVPPITPLGFDINTAFFNPGCDVVMNTARCEFDQDNCCSDPSFCADSGNPNFFAEVGTCMACIDDEPFADFCSYHRSSIFSCLRDNNNCFNGPSYEAQLDPFRVYVGEDLCNQQVACQAVAPAVSNCVIAIVNAELIVASTVNETCSAIDSIRACFDATPCSSTLVEVFALSFVGRPNDFCKPQNNSFDAAACEASMKVTPFGSVFSFDSQDVGDENCQYNLNTPECAYDGGDCCKVFSDPGGFRSTACLEEGAYPLISSCYACLDVAPFSLETSPTDLCPFVSAFSSCISGIPECSSSIYENANGEAHPGLELEEAELFSNTFCSDPGCAAGDLYFCFLNSTQLSQGGGEYEPRRVLSPFKGLGYASGQDPFVDRELQEQGGVTCDILVELEACHAGSGCSGGNFLQFLIDFSPLFIPPADALGFCRGCQLANLTLIANPSNNGCQNFQFSATLDLPTECAATIDAWSGIPGASNQFEFTWIVTPQFSNDGPEINITASTLEFDPFAVGGPGADVTLIATSTVVPGVQLSTSLFVPYPECQTFVPTECADKVDDFYAGAAPLNVTLSNAACDQINNIPECAYDRGNCCLTADQCIDPAEPLFNSYAAACSACNIRQPGQPFCEFYESVAPCWAANGCDQRFTFDVIPRSVLFGAVDLCRQTTSCIAVAESSHDCLFQQLQNILTTPPLFQIFCPSVESTLQTCYPSACSGKVIASLLASEVASPELCLNRTTVNVAVCEGSRIQSPLLSLTDEVIDAEDLGDNDCDIGLNTVECDFDQGDCCLADVGATTFSAPFYDIPFPSCVKDNSYPRIDACMACLTNAPAFDFNDLANTACPWASSAAPCLQANQCVDFQTASLSFFEANAFALFLQDACGDPGCDVPTLYECTRCAAVPGASNCTTRRILGVDIPEVFWNGFGATSSRDLQAVDPLTCGAVTGIEQCVRVEAGCRPSTFTTILSGAVTSSKFVAATNDEVMAQCFGCNDIQLSFTQVGDKICEPMSFIGVATPSTQCQDAVTLYFDDKTVLSNLVHSWNLTFGSVGPGLQRIETFQTFTGASVQFNPYDVFALRDATVIYSVSNPSNGIVNGSITFPVNLTRTPNVAVMSETGTIKFLDDDLGREVLVDGYRSCIPDNIGCALCPPTGFAGTFPPGAEEVLIYTLTGFLVKDPGETEPELQNEEIYAYGSEAGGEIRFEDFYSVRWASNGGLPPAPPGTNEGTRYRLQASTMDLSSQPYTLQYNVIEKDTFSFVPSSQLLVRFLNASTVVPEACEADTLNLYTLNAVDVTFFDNVCSLENNLANCSFDNNRCCGTTETCVDPVSANFNPTAVQCMDCLTRGSRSFCEWFDELDTCFEANSCPTVFRDYINSDARFIADDLCNQVLCSVSPDAEHVLACIHASTSNGFSFPPDGCAAGDIIQQCFPPVSNCFDSLLKKYYEQTNLNPQTDCDGEISSVIGATCLASTIPSPFDLTDPNDIVNVGNLECDSRFNVPECNFDGGDCCVLSQGGSHFCVEDGAYAAQSACLACLANTPYDPNSIEFTFCPWLDVATTCALQNDCKNVTGDELLAVIEGPVKELFGPICDTGCRGGRVFECLATSNVSLGSEYEGQGSRRLLDQALDLTPTEESLDWAMDTVGDGRSLAQLPCDQVVGFADCFLNTDCPKSEMYKLAGINETDLPFYLSTCYGCNTGLSLLTSVSGTRICSEVVFSVDVTVPTECSNAVAGLFDPPADITNQFLLNWQLEDFLTRRRLQEVVTGSGRTLVVKPFELINDNFLATVTVTSAAFNGLTGTDSLGFPLSSLQKTAIVPKTSSIGTVVIYTGPVGVQLFEINAFGSCVPDNIGCGLCPPSGFTGALATGEAAILAQTGFTGAHAFTWNVTCQNPPCTVPDGSGPTFQIQNADLSLSNSPYLITLTITDSVEGTSVSAAPITVEVLDGLILDPSCFIPSLSITSTAAAASFDPVAQAQVLVINEGQRGNVLLADVTTPDGLPIDPTTLALFNLEWVFLGGVVANGIVFAIEDELLLSNPAPYTFTLFARPGCTNGQDPFATLILNINQPPVNGSVAVSPPSGETLNTKFQFSASDWVDPEDNLPLQYAFFADGAILRPRSTSSTLSDIVLSGDGATAAFVRVFDFLGAKTDSDPFFVTLTPIAVEDIELSVFEDASREGADEEELIDFVSVVMKAVNSDVNNTNTAEAAALRKAAFETLRDATASKRNQNVSTLEDAARAATTFKEVLSDPDQLDEDDFSDFAGFFNDLLDDTKQQDLNDGSGVEDTLFEDLLEGTSTLLSTLVGLGFGRRLQANSATCTNIGSLRDVVKDVGLVVTKDDVSGAFVRTVNSSAIRLAAATTSGTEIGSLSFGDVNVTIPGDIGAGSGDITTVLSQFDFNVRLCDDAETDLLDAITSIDECAGTLNASGNFAPVKPPENVISLEFRNTLENGGDIAVEPTDLDEPIVLRLPLGSLDEDDNGICANFTLLSCGFYSESAGGFRTDGCSVTDIDLVDGTLECTCNHASDYAAWVAFQQDVVDVFTKPLSLVTLFGVLLSTSLMLGVFATYCLCFLWGNNRDKNSARALQKEAIGVMVLNQFLLRQRQRQFFANLREAVEKAKDPERVEAPVEAKKHHQSLCNRVITAVKYEHSLLGLTRYDPHYTRIQRVSIFIAVVMGNLFIAALFFELKDSEVDDLSPGFIIVVVLVSSLAVAIPIRLIIKMLFRITDYQNGSSADRITQLYRISLEAELDFKLVMNNPKDVHLIHAFKDVYIAKERLRSLGVHVSDYRCGCCPSEAIDDSNAMEEDVIEVADEEEGDAGEKKPVSRANQIAEAKARLAETMAALKVATQEAKEDWSQKTNEVALERVKQVNRQKSRFLKIAALVAEDAAPAAKARRALCPYWMIYLSWGILIALYGLSVFYVVRFILTRADRAELPSVTRTEEELVGVWLVSASLGILIGYCIAEPLIAIVRYALLPYCVAKCGAKEGEEEEEEAVVAQAEVEMNKLNEVQTGEFEKQQAEQARGQYVLEFLSDLVETIY